MYVKILEQVSISHVFLKEVKGKSMKNIKNVDYKTFATSCGKYLVTIFPILERTFNDSKGKI